MTYTETEFRNLHRDDLERAKFALDASGKVAIRFINGIESRGVPVETRADLPLTGIMPGHAIVVYNDPVLLSTIAIRNGIERVQLGGGDPLDCAGVKECIENFTSLDLSNLETLVLGGDITFAEDTTIDRTNTTNTGTQNFDENYIANYDGSTINYNNIEFNYTGDNIVNLAETDSITYNLDGTVNNDFGATYIENNIYAEGATLNFEGNVIHNYENYTQNTFYEENVIFNYEGAVTNNYTEYTEVNNYDESSSITYIGGNHYYENTTINYDENTDVTYEGNVEITNLTVQNITMEAGGNVQVAGTWEYEETELGADVHTLVNIPISEKAFMVFVDSGTGLFPTTDYTYNILTNEITFDPQLGTTEKAIIRVMVGNVSVVGPTTPVIPTTATYDASFGDYVLVTYTTGATTINLPNATLLEGGQIRIKKFTGEDVLTTTILPHGTQLIDGFTGATMNINRTMYTFTAINGNWYLGD